MVSQTLVLGSPVNSDEGIDGIYQTVSGNEKNLILIPLNLYMFSFL